MVFIVVPWPLAIELDVVYLVTVSRDHRFNFSSVSKFSLASGPPRLFITSRKLSLHEVRCSTLCYLKSQAKLYSRRVCLQLMELWGHAMSPRNVVNYGWGGGGYFFEHY